MNWEPARAEHSIERATASITLREALDPNIYDELVVKGRKAAAQHNLTDRVDLVEPIEAGPGMTIDLTRFASAPPRRVLFRRLDVDGNPANEISIGMQRIAFGTLRYGRWKDFFGLLTSCVAELEQVYPVTENVRVVRVEYVDRFRSAPGGADHFEVINRDSEYLPRVVADKVAALHAHSGWFEFESSRIRKLTNVNIDVNDIPIPRPADPRRTIGVLSVGQFEALEGPLDRPIERLDNLHLYLKSVFRRTITPAAAHRVGLTD